jgi:hypothetical protein
MSAHLPARRAVCGMFPRRQGKSAQRGRPEGASDGFALRYRGKARNRRSVPRSVRDNHRPGAPTRPRADNVTKSHSARDPCTISTSGVLIVTEPGRGGGFVTLFRSSDRLGPTPSKAKPPVADRRPNAAGAKRPPPEAPPPKSGRRYIAPQPHDPRCRAPKGSPHSRATLDLQSPRLVVLPTRTRRTKLSTLGSKSDLYYE